jgi:hypothetical protein
VGVVGVVRIVSLHWPEEWLKEFRAKQEQWKAQGTVRTHTSRDEEAKPEPEQKAERKAAWRKKYNAQRREAREQKKPVKKQPPSAVILLLAQLEGLPAPSSEHRFHQKRLWRFDLAWPEQKVAVEVDGGVWTQGRHSRGDGMEKDNEKINTAQILGWTVLRYSTGQIKRGDALADLRAIFGAEAR